MENPYVALTRAFNEGRLRALLSSGQAVVLHRLAVASKDGDWILREDDETCGHVLEVLQRQGATYRFGAPLDTSWLAGGWSAHFEFRQEGLRLRTDFVTRPPRLDEEALGGVWESAERERDPVVPIEPLAAIKLTCREKDYAVVGELARRMPDPRAQLLYSRSSRDLLELAVEHGALVRELSARRPLLELIPEGRDVLDEALDRERRALMRADEARLRRYRDAYQGWAEAWPRTKEEIENMPLLEAHQVVVERAKALLPSSPAGVP